MATKEPILDHKRQPWRIPSERRITMPWMAIIVASIATIISWAVIPGGMYYVLPWWTPIGIGAGIFIFMLLGKAAGIIASIFLAVCAAVALLWSIGGSIGGGASALYSALPSFSAPAAPRCLISPVVTQQEQHTKLRSALMGRAYWGETPTLMDNVAARKLTATQASAAIQSALDAFSAGTTETLPSHPSVSTLPPEAKKWLLDTMRQHSAAAANATPSTWEQHAPTWAGGLPPCD